jgi:PTS system beta-glucosides-specific IIC component
MLGSLKEKLGFGKKAGEVLGAPIQGKAIAISEVNDPTFAEELLGKGVAIVPAVGKVVAPIDGTVNMVFGTKHAISMTSDSGIEILIHVGLDTVMLKGQHYTAHVESGDTVKKGDLMLEFDMEAIKAAGYEVITPVIVCNADDYKDVIRTTGKQVEPGDTVMELDK